MSLMLLLLFAGVVVAVIVALLAFARSRAPRPFAASVSLTGEATVVDKRADPVAVAGRPSQQGYYVTFQFPDGSRAELQVPSPEYGVLVVGDQGTLSWQGPRYLGFARTLMR